MSFDIPSEFPTFARADYLVTKDIDAEDWKKILDAHHREFAESGSRIPGLWPSVDAATFTTTSATLTQSSDGDLNWDVWHPCTLLNRDLQSGASEVLILEFVAHVNQCEVAYSIVAEDTDGTSTSLGTVTLTPSGSSTEKVTGTLSITAANADEGASAGADPRTITIYARGLATNSPTTGTVYADHVQEARLTTSDTAKVPRGY